MPRGADILGRRPGQRDRRRRRFQIAAHSAQVSGGGEAEDSPRTVITAPQ